MYIYLFNYLSFIYICLIAWKMRPREGRGATTATEEGPLQSESDELMTETSLDLQ